MSSTIIDIICVISLLLLYINNYKHLLKIYNSVRVSNELGAGHPKSASFSVVIVTLSSLIIAVILAILVLVLRHVISYVFTSGTTVSDAVSELTPFLAISIVLNGIQPVLSGKNFVLLNFGNIGASLFTFFGNDFLALVIRAH
jgi:Na+-driven multidrug efflux pump